LQVALCRIVRSWLPQFPFGKATVVYRGKYQFKRENRGHGRLGLLQQRCEVAHKRSRAPVVQLCRGSIRGSRTRYAGTHTVGSPQFIAQDHAARSESARGLTQRASELTWISQNLSDRRARAAHGPAQPRCRCLRSAVHGGGKRRGLIMPTVARAPSALRPTLLRARAARRAHSGF
jgi:hypothetical protein